MKTELTVQRLRELLCYDAETGVFTRLTAAGGRNGLKFAAGTVVGSDKGNGYLEVGIDGDSYLLHRLAWLYVTGGWPPAQIDHINGARADNRFSNLRPVDNRTNIENRVRPNKNSSSGLLGAHRDGRRGGWAAQITVARKCIHLGRFESPEAAHAAYVAAKRRLHKGCTL